ADRPERGGRAPRVAELLEAGERLVQQRERRRLARDGSRREPRDRAGRRGADEVAALLEPRTGSRQLHGRRLKVELEEREQPVEAHEPSALLEREFLLVDERAADPRLPFVEPAVEPEPEPNAAEQSRDLVAPVVRAQPRELGAQRVGFEID